MIKKLCLVIAFLFCSLVYSQKNLGVFAGLNYSYFTDGFAKQINASNKFGLQFGVLYNIQLTNTISFRPKGVFSVQGDKESETTAPFDLNQVDHKLTYLNIPLDFKFGNKIYIITGPQVGILLSQNKLSENAVTLKSKYDYGLNFGAGFQVDKLFFEVGIYQGLMNLFSVPSTTQEEDIRNGLLKFTVGYNYL
ncbi:MAG: porin family protein [Aequorivita antarctica]